MHKGDRTSLWDFSLDRFLKATCAKVSWSVVCQTNKEGGLGIRDLKVVNRVNLLKLI